MTVNKTSVQNQRSTGGLRVGKKKTLDITYEHGVFIKLGSLRYATARRYYGERHRARLGGTGRLTRQTQMITICALS